MTLNFVLSGQLLFEFVPYPACPDASLQMAVINSIMHFKPHLQALKVSSQAYLIPDERDSSPVGYCSQHGQYNKLPFRQPGQLDNQPLMSMRFKLIPLIKLAVP